MSLHRPRHAYLLALPCMLLDRGVDLAVSITEENVSDDSGYNDGTDERKSYHAMIGASLKKKALLHSAFIRGKAMLEFLFQCGLEIPYSTTNNKECSRSRCRAGERVYPPVPCGKMTQQMRKPFVKKMWAAS